MEHPILKKHNVTLSGNGEQTMLFANGFGCNQAVWRFVTPAFEENYRIVLFDYIGTGGTDSSAYDPRRYSRLSGYAEDVLDICRALNLHDVIFIGHSVSSMIGVLAARREPERFAHLVMLCPSPRYINDPPHYYGGFEQEDLRGLLDLMEKNDLNWVNFLAPMVMQNLDRPELKNELAGSFCTTDPKIAYEFAEVTFFSDNRDDLRGVPVPSLVLQSSHDPIAPPPVGKFVHETMQRSILHQLNRGSGRKRSLA